MARKVHGVVKHPHNLNPISAAPEHDEMPWRCHPVMTGLMTATVFDVKKSNASGKIVPKLNAWPLRIDVQVIESGLDQTAVTRSGYRSKPFLAPG